MKRKIAVFMGIVLATNNTQVLLANSYDMVKQSENNSIDEEEIEIPYDESEYQYLTIGDKPFTEELYKYLVKENKPFAIYDNRLLQVARATERVYLNSSTFPDQQFRTSLANALSVSEGTEITEKIQTCTSLTLKKIPTGTTDDQYWDNIIGLSKFKNLKEINFPTDTNVAVIVTVVIQDYSELSKMPQLEKIFMDVDNNQNMSTANFPYSDLVNVKEFHIKYTVVNGTNDGIGINFSQIYRNLQYMTGLETLILDSWGGGGELDVMYLYYLRNSLKKIVTSGFNFTTLNYFKYLVNLECLQIKYTGNIIDLSFLQYLTNLRELELPYGRVGNYGREYRFNVEDLKYLPKTKHPIKITSLTYNGDNYKFASNSTDFSWYKDARLSETPSSTDFYNGYANYVIYGKPLYNITNIIGTSKTYDATTEANIESLSFTGLQNGDILTKDVDYTINSASFTNINVGTNKNINVEITLKDTPMTEKYFFTNTNNPRLRTFTISNGVIIKADTSINNTSISTISGKRSNVFTFDDTIRIEGTPVAPSVSSGVSIDEGTETIKLYIGGIEVDTKPATLNNKVSFEVNLSSSVLDSLSVGNHEVKLVYSGNSNLNESEVSLGNITINPIPLKATISQTFTYNGSDNFTVSLSNIKKKSNSSTVSGLTGSASITVPNSNVGTYNTFTVNSINLSGTKSSRYTIATNNTDVTGQIVINKKPITISSAVINDKTYDGTTNASVSSATFNGLISGQTLQSGIDYNATGSFNDKNVGNSKQVTTTINLLNTTKANNYQLNSTTYQTTGNILKSNSTISETKILNRDGTETNTFDFSDTLVIEATPKLTRNRAVQNEQMQLLLNDEVIATEIARENTKTTFNVQLNDLDIGVGTYELKLRFGGDNNLNGSEISLGNITINPIKLIAEIDEQIIYNGQNSVPINLKNIQAKDGASVASSITGTAIAILDNCNVGTYNKFIINNVNLLGDKSNHYIIENPSQDITGQIVINKKPITINSVTVESKKYDGTTIANILNVNFDGLVPSETLEKDVDFVTTGVFDDENVGIDKNVISNINLLDTEKANNYQLDNTTYQTIGSINKAESIINDIRITNENDEENITFDFSDTLIVEAVPQIDENKTRNIQNEQMELLLNNEVIDTQIATENEKAVFNVPLKDLSISAGTYELKLRFGGDNNLNASETSLGAITINPIKLKAEIDEQVVYSGQNILEISLKNIRTKENEELVQNAICNPTIILQNNNVGTYEEFIINGINISGVNNPQQYILLPEDISGQIVIDKKPITISSANVLNKTYDGTESADILDVIFNGVENNEILQKDIDYLATGVFEDKNANIDKNVNVNVNLLDTEKANNYELQIETIQTTGNITKAESKISDVKISNEEGEETNTFDFSDTLVIEAIPKLDSGENRTLQTEQMELLLNGKVIATEIAKENEKVVFNVPLKDLQIDVGTYELEIRFSGDNNLNSSETNLSSVLGQITINPISVKLDAKALNTLTYGDTLNDLKIDYIATYDNKEIVGKLTINDDLTKVLNAGEHFINVTFTSENKVYNSVSKDILVTVEKFVAKQIEEPQITEVSSDGQKLSDVKFITKGKFNGYDSKEIDVQDYELIWENEEEQVVKEKSYKYKLVNNNYIYIGEIVPYKKQNNTTNKNDNDSNDSNSNNKNDINSGNGVNIGTEHIDNNDTTNNTEKGDKNNDSMFDDLKNHWAKDEIEYLAKKGIIKGNNGLIKPDEFITRADFAVLLNQTIKYLELNEDDIIIENKYKDLSSEKYYYRDVCETTFLNVLVGYNNGLFKPENFITREESVVGVSKLMNLCKLNIQAIYSKDFKDYNKISSWAKPYFDDLNKKGIINGYTNNEEFKPKATITRAEAMVMIFNLLTKM